MYNVLPSLSYCVDLTNLLTNGINGSFSINSVVPTPSEKSTRSIATTDPSSLGLSTAPPTRRSVCSVLPENEIAPSVESHKYSSTPVRRVLPKLLTSFTLPPMASSFSFPSSSIAPDPTADTTVIPFLVEAITKTFTFPQTEEVKEDEALKCETPLCSDVGEADASSKVDPGSSSNSPNNKINPKKSSASTKRNSEPGKSKDTKKDDAIESPDVKEVIEDDNIVRHVDDKDIERIWEYEEGQRFFDDDREDNRNNARMRIPTVQARNFRQTVPTQWFPFVLR